MDREVKIVHVQVIDGDTEDAKLVGETLNKFKEKLQDTSGYELEFLISNDRVELRDVRALIKELMVLYKRQQKWYEQTQAKKSEVDETT
jgi:hypothetical protein